MFLYLLSTAGFMYCSWVFAKLAKSSVSMLPLWACSESGRAVVALLSTLSSIAFLVMFISGFVLCPWYVPLIAFVFGCLSGVLPPWFPLSAIALLISVATSIGFFAST